MLSNTYGLSDQIEPVTGYNYSDCCSFSIEYTKSNEVTEKLVALDENDSLDLKRFCVTVNNLTGITPEFKHYNKIEHNNLAYPGMVVNTYNNIIITTTEDT